MLDLLDPGVEGFRCVSGFDRDFFLGDDRSGVHAGIDEVDGDAGDGFPRLERLFPRFESGELW